MDQLWVLLGRFHPLAVHLPIGIFVLLALVELAAAFPRMPRLTDAHRTLILGLGNGFALLAASFGWLLARAGAYDAALLDRHQLAGISVAILAAGLLIVHRRNWRGTYRVLLGLMVLMIAAAGHLGGSLTHGENYLTAATVTAKRNTPLDPQVARVFDDIIHPILQQRCAGCHGPTKSNGDLRYDTFEHLMTGGKGGAVLVAGDAGRSRMIQRIHLPLDAKEHMPPKAKPQLTEDEIALVEWWIDAGAPHRERVAEIAAPPAIAELIAARLGVPPPPIPERATVLAAADALERRLGIVVRPLSADGPWLAANARLQFARFGDAELAELAAIAPALHWLDLGETAITDAGLAALAPMKNLRRLQLDRTAVTDAGLAHLSGLLQLESLNLHGTKVTDAAFGPLRALPRLRALYLWQTEATPAAAAEFAAKQVDPRKIERWKAEISALEAKISAEQFSANLGELDRVPVNTTASIPKVVTPANPAVEPSVDPK